jgi:hypothetical protein
VDNIGDGRHNSSIANHVFGIAAPKVGNLTYSAVTEDRCLAVARSLASMSRPPPLQAPSPGGRDRSNSSHAARLTLFRDDGERASPGPVCAVRATCPGPAREPRSHPPPVCDRGFYWAQCSAGRRSPSTRFSCNAASARSRPSLVRTARRPRLPHSPGNPAKSWPLIMLALHSGRPTPTRRDARLALGRKPLTLWHATGTATRCRRAPRRPSCSSSYRRASGHRRASYRSGYGRCQHRA